MDFRDDVYGIVFGFSSLMTGPLIFWGWLTSPRSDVLIDMEMLHEMLTRVLKIVRIVSIKGFTVETRKIPGCLVSDAQSLTLDLRKDKDISNGWHGFCVKANFENPSICRRLVYHVENPSSKDKIPLECRDREENILGETKLGRWTPLKVSEKKLVQLKAEIGKSFRYSCIDFWKPLYCCSQKLYLRCTTYLDMSMWKF